MQSTSFLHPGLPTPHRLPTPIDWQGTIFGIWLPEHQVEFDTLKSILSGNLVVRHFNKDKPVYLLTDASRVFGLGYALGHL